LVDECDAFLDLLVGGNEIAWIYHSLEVEEPAEEGVHSE
jgi:hypothetical protein